MVPGDKFDLLGPAMSRVGRETMAVVGGEPSHVFLYVEAGDNWISPSPFRDEGDQVRYFRPSHELCDALSDLWYIEEPDKRWTEMHYTIENGKFSATFEFEDMNLPDDGSMDRRDRVLHARYGDKPVVYPPPMKGAMEYRPEP